jgi:hypothetical protein
MTERDAYKLNGSAAGKAPARVVPTAKVNVAFPFAQIKIQEPSQDLAALASLVSELAGLVAEAAPGPTIWQAN